ncbi:uncharacterized protein LOC128217615 [Mya arenaria]|uniref:uncharacterized protein LOC128217615 n=1 Tax=Mya arenaria TaxID=6604 RepID=UPI0022E471DD|nr:uncharacterized protein LOC128217615 [Mya arenaria]
MANGFDPHMSWRSLPYFHDHFRTTEEVAKFIKKRAKNKPYHFLLRPSNRDRSRLTASIFCSDDSVRHTTLMSEPGGKHGTLYFLVPEKKFECVESLVDYYASNPVKNLENVSNVYLRKPIKRDDWAEGSLDGDSLKRSVSNRSINSNQSNGSISRMAQSMSFDSGSSAGMSVPALPMRPRTQSNGSNSTIGSVQASMPSNMSYLSSRPPLPLPQAINTQKDDGPYMYSKARDVSEDISEKLKDVLKSSERCECGIPRHLAELPMGWTVHLSKDEMSKGRLFYQNDAGITSWTMPNDVKMQLTKKHIQNLTRIDPNWKLPH